MTTIWLCIDMNYSMVIQKITTIQLETVSTIIHGLTDGTDLMIVPLSIR